MNSDTKEQFFYIRNKRCKVAANDQCITIQSDLTPNCKSPLDLSFCSVFKQIVSNNYSNSLYISLRSEYASKGA